MVKKLILLILFLVLFSMSVVAVPGLTVTNIDEAGDYVNANGNYTYVGTNDNTHNYWNKTGDGSGDYYVYFENGFDGWIIVYEEDDSHAVAGDSPNNANYYIRGQTYALGAEGVYTMGEDEANVVNQTEEEEEPGAVSEFSDYAIALLLLTVVGGFFTMRARREE